MKPDFHSIYPDPFEAELCEGYYDGRRLDNPEPNGNRHPAYVHGFFNGRDDAECSRGIRRFPRKTAQQKREDLAYIEAAFRDDVPTPTKEGNDANEDQ